MIALLLLAAGVVDPSWSQANLPSARGGSAATVSNGRLYVAGGFNSTAGIGDVLLAPLGGDGSVGSFTPLTSLPTPAGSIAISIANGRLYVAGGNISEVDYAFVNASDGTIGAFTATAPLNDAPYGNGLVYHGGALFSIGGAHVTGGASPTTTFFNHVFSAPVPVGTPDLTWSGSTALPEALAYSATAFAGSVIYVIGGQQAATGPEFGGVYAVTDSAGALGTWAAIADLPYGVMGATAFASGGFLFVVGGETAGVQRNDVLQARILTPSSLGSWIHGTPLTTARYLHAGAVNNGYAYVIGGYGGGAYQQTIEYKKLTTPGPAAKLLISGAPSTAHVGDCVGPLTVSLQDISGAATWADADIHLSIAGNGQMHSEETCGGSSQTSQYTIAGGTESTQFWVYAVSAGVPLAPSVSDNGGVLTSATSSSIAVAAATPPPSGAPDPHGVNGWGCSSSGAGWLALLAALFVAKRHRRIEA